MIGPGKEGLLPAETYDAFADLNTFDERSLERLAVSDTIRLLRDAGYMRVSQVRALLKAAEEFGFGVDDD